MSQLLLLAVSPGEVRVALVEGGTLLDYALHRPGHPDGVGDLHVGRVTAMVPALGGAFVQIGAASGFLPDRYGADGQSEGALVAVRVTRSGQGGKGPRLTARLDAGEQASCSANDAGPLLVARGPDAMQRFASAWPEAAIRCDDASLGAHLHRCLDRPVQIAPRAFDDHLEAEIEALSEPDIALPGGLRASIHATPALVAIDVDGAASTAERRPKATVQFAANRKAIPALAHQLRLRNLSGAILVDLAGLAVRKRRALADDFERALARDPLRPRLLGFTALGFAEILRPRIHPPLHELQHSPLGIGLSALRAASRAHQPHGKSTIRGGIAIIAALHSDPEALAAFARGSGSPISLRMDPMLPELSWTIEHE